MGHQGLQYIHYEEYHSDGNPGKVTVTQQGQVPTLQVTSPSPVLSLLQTLLAEFSYRYCSIICKRFSTYIYRYVKKKKPLLFDGKEVWYNIQNNNVVVY